MDPPVAVLHFTAPVEPLKAIITPALEPKYIVLSGPTIGLELVSTYSVFSQVDHATTFVAPYPIPNPELSEFPRYLGHAATIAATARVAV